jgi:undecaprenyl-diphosphatase
MDIHLIAISVLEGLTEFLPISSTAHLIITAKLFAVDLTDAYIKFYLLFIQLGALCAGAFIFARRIFTDKTLFINICISFLPSAVVGFLAYKLFKQLLEGNMLVLALALLIGGIIFIYLEKVYMKRGGIEDIKDFGKKEITKTDAFIVGLAQAVAIIPGVSRSGATIVAGILRGIKREVIFEYTFILALPTLGAAVLYDAYKSRDMLASINSYGDLFTGFLIAFVTASIALYILRKYLSRITLSFFGWYRIVLAIFVLMIFVV